MYPHFFISVLPCFYVQYVHKFPPLLLIFLVEAIEVKRDDFWDYDKQVDLEGFTTTDFYDHLSRQSRHVTSELGRQKDEV